MNQKRLRQKRRFCAWIANQILKTNVVCLKHLAFSDWFIGSVKETLPQKKKDLEFLEASKIPPVDEGRRSRLLIEFSWKFNPPEEGEGVEAKGLRDRKPGKDGHLHLGDNPRGLATPKGVTGEGDPGGLATPAGATPRMTQECLGSTTARFNGTGLG